ncbi:hypothetical protein SSX86_008842 [Deinandra increscens subsp. villosa]|uniref:RBR-type E3 ubiquitin transferase n=1 Tax=Deinandra increscens subsp. villosa TaxID=3103831 RepID=A0AAP0DG58_9ASTR
MSINFNFTLPKPSSSSWPDGEIWYAAAGPLALLIIVSYVYSSKKKKDTIETDDEEIIWKPASDVLLEEEKDEMSLEADAHYAEELQVQEALFASQNTNININKNASTSTLLKVCKICLETQESWQMFTNSTCSHSFCYTCITKHATTKIQDKNRTISCPEINCKSTLDSDILRLIIPNQTLINWDEILCESMILESHKLYCPFTNCSVLLINDDTRNIVTKTDCPACRRAFCAVCRVPWHSEFSCKEFGKLKGGKKEDEMAVALAKKKKWKKCPNCNFFVEKTEGCVHITCRCKYEFCYKCGVKWSSNHGGCRPRS